MGFGKSSQKSDSQSQQSSLATNQAFPLIRDKLSGEIDNASRGSSAIMDLLGLNGAQGQSEGFQRFKDSSGYNFIKDEGIRGITGSNAAKGLLNSGSAMKGIANYSSNLASGFLDRYLKSLTDVNNSGLQAGQIVTGAGNTSTSSGNSTSKSSGSSFNANFTG